MDLEIRQAVEADVPEIMRIYNHAIEHTTATFDTEPKTLEDRIRWFHERTEGYPVIAAVIDGRLVGWAEIRRYGERNAYRYSIENAVYVDPEQHGKGIGTALLGRLLEIATKNGYHTVLALIVAGNDSSIRLHERFGFREAGIMREVGWKFGAWLDVVILQKMLNDAE